MKLHRIIGYNLKNLANFRGRDARSTFWPYAAFLFIIAMIINWIVMIGFITEGTAGMQQYALENPNSATIEQSSGHYTVQIQDPPADLMPDIADMMISTAIVTTAIFALIAAAVVRRLLDIGKSGLLGLLPLPFLVVSFWAMPTAMAQNHLDMTAFTLVFINNLFYILCVIYLIVALARAGTEGDNRYGEAPPLESNDESAA